MSDPAQEAAKKINRRYGEPGWIYEWVSLDALIEAAREYVRTHDMNTEQCKQQIRSFAYGNLKMHNPAITMEDIDRAIAELNDI